MLSWGSFSFFDPELKASFVLRIKGGERFEEQGSISWHALQLFVCFLCTMTKINFCYHATVLAIWFSIVLQFDNSSPWIFLNIAQCTIGIGLRFFILVLSINGAVFVSYNSIILQFSCNFSLVVVNSFSLFVVFFVCFLLFVFFFHFVYLVINRFLLNILLISCSIQVSFIFNMYIQLIIAGLKTSLHLTPFCLLELILAIIKKRKKKIKYRGLSDC